jgi:sugar/nucleoside kinase (ribokinase family)
MTTCDFDVIAIGGAAFDIPVRPVPGDIMQIGSISADIRMATGGDALNGSISMASLGLRTALIAYLGTDIFGDAVVARLKQAGVDTSLILRDENHMTPLAYLLIEESGERHILGHGHAAARAGLCSAHVPDATLRRARHLHYASVNANKFLDGDGIADVFARAQALGLTTSMDAAFDRDGVWLDKSRAALQHCDIFFPSYSEAVPIAQGRTDVSDMTEFFRPFGLKYFGCKLGAQGVYLYDYTKERAYRMPSLLRGAVVDTTGAGDAFCAGFLTGFLRGWPLEECLALGSAQSALIIGSVGANMGVRDLVTAVRYAQQSGCDMQSARQEGLL